MVSHSSSYNNGTINSFVVFQGGKSSRIVNSVLALKSYNEWKQAGGNGVWKFGGNVKLTTPMRQHVRKNSEPFTNSLSRNVSMNEKTLSNLCPDNDSSKTVCEPTIIRTCSLSNFNPMQTLISCFYFYMQSSSPLSALVRAVLLDKKAEEVPSVSRTVHGSIYSLENSLTNLSETFTPFSGRQYERDITCCLKMSIQVIKY